MPGEPTVTVLAVFVRTRTGRGVIQHAVGVAARVDVEADEVALVVDAVDGGGADAARVRNCGEPGPRRSR